MDGTRRTGSALTGRPMRETLGVRPRLADVAARQPEPHDAPRDLDGRDQETRDHATRDHESDIAASIETINKVTETYGILLDKLSAYELKVRDLGRRLADEERVTGDALRAAARAEESARDAQARSARAEAEAARSADTVRELERQLAALRGQTAKLMDAVDQLFPDLDEGASEQLRGLRVVR